MKRLNEIDFIRGICIIYMIFGHIVVNNNFDHYIHAFHMPLFYVVSGYFVCRNTKNFWPNIKKIFNKLHVPYILWGIIFSCFYAFITNKNISDSIYYLKLLFSYNDSLPFAGALWFLTSFFFASIIFKIINNIKSDLIFSILCLVVMYFGIYYEHFFDVKLILSIQSSFVGVGLMMIGYLIKKFDLINKFAINDFYLLILLGITNYFLVMKTGYVNMRSNNYPNFLLFIINILLSLIVYLSLTKIMKNNCKSLYSKIIYIGENSIYFLILNQFVIYIVQKIYMKYGFNMFISNIIFEWVLIGYITILTIYILTKYISRFKIKFIFGK